MDSISPVSASMYMPAATPAASADSSSAGSSSIADASPGPAASLMLSTLQLQSQMVTTLLGSLDTNGAGSSSAFTGGSMMSLLNAGGSAAMAYLTPQAATAGQHVNAAA